MKKYIDRLKNIFVKIKNSPKIYLSIILVIILLIIPIILAMRSHVTNRGTLQVNGKVKDAQFIFNNQVYYVPITIKNIIPGKYSITAHNAGYVDESDAVSIAADKTVTVTLKMQIFPKNASHKAVLQNRGEDENEQAILYAKKANQEIQTRATTYPFTNYLPQAFGPLMLDYQVGTDGKVQYVVYSIQKESYNKADYQQQINNFIQSKGINPATITLQWE